MSRSVVRQLLVLLFLPAALLLGKGISGIVGYITDPTGGRVHGTAFQVVAQDTGLVYQAITDVEGGFVFPQLPVGVYQVVVEATGVRRSEQSQIRLQVGERQTLRISLDIGQLTESLTVQGAAPLVNAANPILGIVVGEKRIQDLPL